MHLIFKNISFAPCFLFFHGVQKHKSSVFLSDRGVKRNGPLQLEGVPDGHIRKHDEEVEWEVKEEERKSCPAMQSPWERHLKSH